jgi:hypothetical protein
VILDLGMPPSRGRGWHSFAYGPFFHSAKSAALHNPDPGITVVQRWVVHGVVPRRPGRGRYPNERPRCQGMELGAGRPSQASEAAMAPPCVHRASWVLSVGRLVCVEDPPPTTDRSSDSSRGGGLERLWVVVACGYMNQGKKASSPGTAFLFLSLRRSARWQ